jgi:hypothetical protein
MNNQSVDTLGKNVLRVYRRYENLMLVLGTRLIEASLALPLLATSSLARALHARGQQQAEP